MPACFKCNKQLDPVAATEELPHIQPYDGTMWATNGNYGSTLFDPIEDPTAYFVIVICDECLAANTGKVFAFRDSEHVTVEEVLGDKE